MICEFGTMYSTKQSILYMKNIIFLNESAKTPIYITFYLKNNTINALTNKL